MERAHATIILQNMYSNNILLAVYPLQEATVGTDEKKFYDDATHLYTFCSIPQIDAETPKTQVALPPRPEHDR